MKRTIQLMTVIFLWIVAVALSSFKNHPVPGDAVPVTLTDAIKNKWIIGKYTGAGAYSGNCIKINASNLKDKKLRIAIPAGTMFEPGDEGMQNILVTQEQVLVLAPGQKLETYIKGFCCQATDRAPSKDIIFTVTLNKDPKMIRLFQFLKGKNLDNDLQQEAVWCISDAHSVSDLYASNMDNIKPLREELCKITGQADTWYNTPRQHTVDADGNISHTTTEVNGLIKFKAGKTAKVHNEIHDATGKLVIRNPNEFTVKPGNVEYEFAIKVQGWQKGTYYVEVYEDTRVIHRQEFKI